MIAAGNEFCKINDDPAALARLAVKEIRATRLQLHRQDETLREETERPADELIRSARPRTAYILHSLKRSDEVELLREIYAGQFILIGSQGTYEQRLPDRQISRPPGLRGFQQCAPVGHEWSRYECSQAVGETSGFETNFCDISPWAIRRSASWSARVADMICFKTTWAEPVTAATQLARKFTEIDHRISQNS